MITAKEMALKTVEARDEAARALKIKQDAWPYQDHLTDILSKAEYAAASGYDSIAISNTFEHWQYAVIQRELENLGYACDKRRRRFEREIVVSWEIPNFDPI